VTEDAVLVLGGTGFIGVPLVERLASRGRRVIVASRGGIWPLQSAPRGVDVHELDLALLGDDDGTAMSQYGLLTSLLQRASAVVNLAGTLARPGLPRSAYDDLHVLGTARLAEAAAKRAAQGAARSARSRPFRLVHVSTTGVLGPTGPTPLDETATPAPTTPYEKSKLEGERAALMERGGWLEVVVVRPGLVYGPRDVHLAPLYQAIAKGTYRTIAGGKALWQPVYVDDVARAIHLALEDPRCDGGIFHVAGEERLSVAAFAERIAERLGTRIRRPGLPYAVAMAAGAILEAACAPFGAAPPLSRARVRTMTEDRVYAIERARAELGFTPQVGLYEGIGRAIDWYRSHEYL
jgi:nucleoside-diphosphate-sugar epimerase